VRRAARLGFFGGDRFNQALAVIVSQLNLKRNRPGSLTCPTSAQVILETGNYFPFAGDRRPAGTGAVRAFNPTLVIR
jgi:hypothetical protein